MRQDAVTLTSGSNTHLDYISEHIHAHITYTSLSISRLEGRQPPAGVRLLRPRHLSRPNEKTQRLAHDLGLNHWQDFTESARWHLKSPTTWANAEQALQTHSAMLLSLTITSVMLLRKRPDPSLCCPNKLDRRRWGVGWSWNTINTHLRLSKKEYMAPINPSREAHFQIYIIL